MEVVHDEYTRYLGPLEVGHGTAARDVRLEPAATIEGRVLTADGDPVADALITARNDDFAIVRDDPAAFGNGPDSAATAGLVHLLASHQHMATRQPTVVELGVGQRMTAVQVMVRPASWSGAYRPGATRSPNSDAPWSALPCNAKSYRRSSMWSMAMYRR